MIPVISSRKFLANEFARTIATIGRTNIVTNTAKIRTTRNGIGLSCRNYMPVLVGRRQKGAGCKNWKESLSLSAVAAASCASGAIRPQPGPLRPAHTPAPPSPHHESASPSKSPELQRSTSQRLECGSCVSLSCHFSQAAKDASILIFPPPPASPYHENVMQ